MLKKTFEVLLMFGFTQYFIILKYPIIAVKFLSNIAYFLSLIYILGLIKELKTLTRYEHFHNPLTIPYNNAFEISFVKFFLFHLILCRKKNNMTSHENDTNSHES